MKIIKSVFISSLFFIISSNLLSQCNDQSWVPDVILDNTLQFGQYEYVNKKILVSNQFVMNDHFIFTDCDIKVESNWQYGQDHILEMYGSTVTKCSSLQFGFLFEHTFQEEVTVMNFNIQDCNFFLGGNFFEFHPTNSSQFIFKNNLILTEYLEPTTPKHFFTFREYPENSQLEITGNTFYTHQGILFFRTDSDYEWNFGSNDEAPNVVYDMRGNTFNNLNWLISGSENGFVSDGILRIENLYMQNGSKAIVGNYGDITLDNCHIDRCNVGFEPTRATTYLVKNCEFNDNEIGISNLSSGKQAINNSEFHDNHIGFKSSLVTPVFSGVDISECVFFNDINIHNTGVFTDAIALSDNTLGALRYNVLGDGESYIQSSSNTFEDGLISHLFYDCGNEMNSMDYNDFYNEIGIYTTGVNSEFTFDNNCFTSEFSDFFNDNGGDLPMFFGNDDIGPGNCFDHNTLSGTFSNNGSSFFYFRPEDEIGTCYDPMGGINYQTEKCEQIFPDFCGSPNTGSNEKRECFVDPDATCVDVRKAIREITEEIEDVLVSNEPELIKSLLIDKLQRCLMELNLLLIEKCMIIKNDYALHGFFNEESEVRFKAKAYGALAQMELWDEAQNYLNNWNPANEEASDFIWVQNLYLDYLRNKNDEDNTEGDLVSASDLNILKSKAEKKYPLAAYARSLYFVLTNEILYPEIDLDFAKEEATNRSSSSNKFTAYPNPVTDQLCLSGDILGIDATILIVDMNGRQVLKNLFSSDNKEHCVNTSSISSGLYIARILNGLNQQVQTVKFVKI